LLWATSTLLLDNAGSDDLKRVFALFDDVHRTRAVLYAVGSNEARARFTAAVDKFNRAVEVRQTYPPSAPQKDDPQWIAGLRAAREAPLTAFRKAAAAFAQLVSDELT
jgi:hypothetical protein